MYVCIWHKRYLVHHVLVRSGGLYHMHPSQNIYFNQWVIVRSKCQFFMSCKGLFCTCMYICIHVTYNEFWWCVEDLRCINVSCFWILWNIASFWHHKLWFECTKIWFVELVYLFFLFSHILKLSWPKWRPHMGTMKMSLIL